MNKKINHIYDSNWITKNEMISNLTSKLKCENFYIKYMSIFLKRFERY